MAVILAAIFGPLGLLYLGIEGLMVVLVVLGVGLFIMPLILSASYEIHGIGLLISLLSRAICVFWAVKTVARKNLEVGISSRPVNL